MLRGKLVGALIALIFLVSAGYDVWLGKNLVRNSFSILLYPLIKLHSQFISPEVDSFDSEQLAALQAENLALRAQAKYWQEHQELIEFAKRYYNDNYLLAQVFLKDLRSCTQFFLVDQGARRGVQVGMVAVWQNYLVGKVTAVYPQFSQITLLTSADCRVAVYGSQTESVGICCGKNQLTELDLNYVSHLQKLQFGEILISSGDGETFPRGFGVGRIKDDQIKGMYHQAVVQPLIDFSKLSACYLVAGNQVALQSS